MMKKIFAVTLAMLMVLCFMPSMAFADVAPTPPSGDWEDYAADAFDGGDGSKDAPWQIKTAEQLAKLAKDINSGETSLLHAKEYFVVTGNIDLSAHKWTPIGYAKDNSGKTFSGYFDGGNFEIKGLYVDESDTEYSAGLFGHIDGFEIKNVKIVDGYVKTKSTSGYDSAGLLIGNATHGYGITIQVTDCSVSGTVESSSAKTGGLVGYSSGAIYTGCSADVEIKGAGKAGGFVGEDYEGKYTQCTAKGDVSGTWSVGGFAGVFFSKSTVKKCAAYGKVSASDWNAGGFAGYIEEKVNISNSVSYGDVNSTPTTYSPKVGGFVGSTVIGYDEATNCKIENSHAEGKVEAAHQTVKAGGFIGYDDDGITVSCSFDKTKNSGLSAVGETNVEGSNDIVAAVTQKVLSNICIDYIGGHKIVTVEGKEATNTETGVIKHWKCSECGSLFSDESGSTETTEEDITIPKKQSGGSNIPLIQQPEATISGGGSKTETTDDGNRVTESAEGKVEISKDGSTATITPAEGKEIEKVMVNGTDMGVISEITGLKTGDKVEVIFKDSATGSDGKAELDKKAAETVAKLEMSARSVKTAKKNIKITLNMNAETSAAIKELRELGYTVKYKFYRSTKKSSAYKSVMTKSETTYTNTSGKKGNMYYYKARVQVFDKDGKLISQTALKQCKYAKRLWTK